MDSQLSCPLCNSQYNDQKIPRLLTMCGHTFCESCIQTIIVPKGQDKFKVVCPEDGTACQLTNNNLNQFPKNLALLKVIQSNKSKSSFKDSSFDVSKIAKQEQIQQDDDTKQLITAIKESQQQESTDILNKGSEASKQGSKELDFDEGQEDQNLCLLHQKPLEVVCIVDLQKICAKCAIFGEHKGHDFKSIQQIQQQNQNFNRDLLAVYEQKSQILKRIENKVTKSQLISILLANKQALTKQVKQRFKRLIDTIKSQEKKAMTKIQKVFQKTEKEIQQLYKIEPVTLEKYEQWERISWQKLQICQSGSFQQKLKLLLIDQAKPQNNIINQGLSIVQQIRNQQDTIINKAEIFISNIGMKTSDKIFDFTQNFVEIYDKPSQLPKEEVHKKQNSKSTHEPLQVPSQKNQHKRLSQEDLLYVDQHHEDAITQEKIQKPSIQEPKTVDNIKIEDVKFVPPIQSKVFNEDVHHRSAKKSSMNLPVEQLQKSSQKNYDNHSQHTSRDNSFISEKVIRPSKKKLKSIKVPQKYQKILQTLYADTIDTLDLTNAELGDNVVLQICQFIPGTKIKTVKFIRNKLSDDVIVKMLPYLTNVITLNLSQNYLTERVLDIFIQNRQMLPKIKNIILSLNKIIERKHKHKIEELRKLEITVSV